MREHETRARWADRCARVCELIGARRHAEDYRARAGVHRQMSVREQITRTEGAHDA